MENRVNKLIQQMQHHDSDERYMATSDLTSLLSGVEGLLDVVLQRPIRTAILKQLDDRSIEVQAVAVKCLATLVQKFHSDQVVDIVSKLGRLIVDSETDNKASRDIYTIGLQTIISSVRESDGATTSGKLMSSVVDGFRIAQEKKDDHLTLTCLSIVKDVMVRFGDRVTNYHQQMLAVLFPLLEHEDESVRKRASVTLGTLVKHLGDELFQKLMEHIVEKIQSKDQSEHSVQVLESHVQTVGVVSVHAGVRVGKYLPSIIPRLQEFCVPDEAADFKEQEQKIELWENCIQAFESVIIHCPNEATPFLKSIVDLSLEFMVYDPNYSYDVEVEEEDDDDGGWGDEDDDEFGDFEEDGEDDQDDDSTWKVRRAAVRTLNAFIVARSDILREFYGSLTDSLVNRFKERDLKVKADVFNAMTNLLKEAVVSGEVEKSNEMRVPVLVRQRSSFATLEGKIDHIIRECDVQLSSNKIGSELETKRAIFSVVRQLVLVCRGRIAEEVSVLIPHIIKAIGDTDHSMKATALELLHLILELNDISKLKQFLPEIAKGVAASVNDAYKKTKIEALRLGGAMAANLPADEFKGLTEELFETTFKAFTMKDMDLEVKGASITTMSLIIAHNAPAVQQEIGKCLPVFLARLKNEVTRLSALRAIACMAESKHSVDLSSIIEEVVSCQCKFLKQQSLELKHETVKCLASLVRNSSSRITPPMFTKMLNEVATHISDSDLHLSHLVIELIASAIAGGFKDIDDATSEAIVAKLIPFLQSPLLQGQALLSVIALFKQFMRTSAESLGFDSLFQRLQGCVDGSMRRSSIIAVAQSQAAMVCELETKSVDDTIGKLLAELGEEKAADHQLQLSLMTVGEIGVSRDTSSHENLFEKLFATLSNESESVRTAGSYALGRTCVGNMTVYLPKLLDLIKENDAHQYFLLQSLREVINTHIERSEEEKFADHLETVTNVLVSHAERKDEGVRSMVSECLGRLIVIDANQILPHLLEMSKSDKVYVRAVVANSLRFCLSPEPPASAMFVEHLPSFLQLLRDKDLSVQRAAIQTANALVHNAVTLLNAELIKDLILPVLYSNTSPKKELIRIVDYGWFKQEEDDGLPLRKAAFQALATILNVAPHRLDMRQFIGFVRVGLVDHDDLQMLTYQILNTVATNHSNALLEVLDNLPPMIKKGIMAQLKRAKGDKPERAKDVLRTAVRVLYHISQLSDVDQCPKFSEFYKRVLKTALLSQMLKEMFSK